MSSRLLLAALFSVTALAACGGGGGASPPAPEPDAAPAPAPAGSVSAPFAVDARPHVAFFGVGRQSLAELISHTQSPEGAVTQINTVNLGAPATVRDIQGDASFAIGRWAAGTVTGGSPGETLTESSNAAYHYVLFNKPASLPATGSPTCDSGAFTTPTYVGGTSVGSSDYRGKASGSAGISFSGAGAAVTLTLNVSNATSSGAGNFSSIVAPTVPTIIAGGSIGTGANNAYLTIGASAASYDVVGGYVVNLASGARYTGTFRFRCQ